MSGQRVLKSFYTRTTFRFWPTSTWPWTL